MQSRREFLKMAAIGGAALALPVGHATASPSALDARFLRVARPADRRAFFAPLRIPPVLKPVRRAGGRVYFETTMRPARTRLLPGKRTPVWSFDGHFPGPTIRVERGVEAVVRRYNRLAVPSSIHLHGGRVPPGSDGQPFDLIRPGGHKDYVYPNDQEAATLWYHDHTHHRTSRNNYMGLSGLYIIDDPAEEELGLPSGEHDVPLILQDRSFKRDGSLRFQDDHDEVIGRRVLVNGRPTPYFRVANRKYRFRILNASHTRGYDLSLDSSEPLVQIASDGGLLTMPAPAPSIQLWPAERGEVVIDFSKYPIGTQVVLQDGLDPASPEMPRPLVRFDVEREEEDTSSLPTLLRPIQRITGGSVEREFELSQNLDTGVWEINGKPFDRNRIDVQPRLGDTEVWTFRNLSSTTHPMHVHLVRFQVLDRDNVPPPPGELGWKDTVRVGPAEVVRIAMTFEGFTGRYVFHCHNLAHEDHSMMALMKVVS